MREVNTPRFVVAGTNSGAGKTTLSIGLMSALQKSGLNVAPFKVGPDYIDPMHHKAAVGCYSRNLDSFFMDPLTIVDSFERGSKGRDIAVVEGVMGLYDGIDALSETASTAEVAKILKAPVILVVDASKSSRSVAAVVKGFKEFDPNVKLKGVVLNKIGSERHKGKVSSAVEHYTGIEVLGALPKDEGMHLPERHLGLVPAHELKKDISIIAKNIEKHINFGRLGEIAKSASAIKFDYPPKKTIKTEKKVGVVYDSAFRFYYAETLEQLSQYATPIFIDALNDKHLPEVDLLYIGGGFPEVFAKGLMKNVQLRKEVYSYCESGKPAYAECGGLMYLGESIQTSEGKFEMVGFLPLKTEMKERYVGMGYVVNETLKDNPLSRVGEEIVGHEFHHSNVVLTDTVDYAFKTKRGQGIDGEHDGILKERVLASYMHVHPLGFNDMITNLLKPRNIIKPS